MRDALMKHLHTAGKFLALLLLLSSVAVSARAGVSVTASALEGLWLRPVGEHSKAESGIEGFYLHDDGTLELVGIASMNGLNWKAEGNKLILTTNTDKNPKPASVKYTVEKLRDSTLTLKAGDYLSGTFEKENPASSTALKDWRLKMDKMYLDDAVEYVRYVDTNASGYQKREKLIGPEKKGWDIRKLVLWSMDGKPVKLIFTEPNGSGKMEFETSIYYHNGQIVFYRGPFSGYVFKNGRLVEYVDVHMHPVTDVTEKDMKETGVGIEKRSRQYLALFNS
jgi:hypothetical protein